jgi:outer membrane protein assembly factor BamD
MKTSLLYSLLLSLFVLGACASNELKKSENPEVVYNEAVRLLEDKSYLEAADFLQEVRRRFPQSRFAILAELRSADLDFNQENFLEAAAAYGVFVDLYPNHADAPYALYRKTQSYYNAAPELVARDQASARDAVKSAQFFLKRYPSSPFAKEVEALLMQSRLKLAQKEAYVARFYQKKKYKESSLRRWEGLLKDYSDISPTEEGKKLLDEAQRNIEKLRKDIES